MDLSKLPRLSQTKAGDAPAPLDPAGGGAQPPPHAAMPVERVAPPAVDAASVWICIAVGVILLLMSPRLIQYLLFRSSFTWTFTDQGQPIPYTQSVFFWADLAITLFALVMIVEGIVLWLGRRPAIVAAALALTVAVTLLNLAYVAWMIGNNYGTQWMGVFAVAFGVYIAIHQVNLLRGLRGAPV
jgi:hypothetical protein